MATKQSTIDFLTDQIRQAGNIRSRKMFGEYALYCNEKVVAFVCDDQLYVKPSSIAHEFLGDEALSPPYPGAKNYYLVPEEKWDDSEWLTEFIQKTAAVLPIPKQKTPRNKKTSKKL
jgi:TfoX/Sxy family transcriptional regulator of competence genes